MELPKVDVEAADELAQWLRFLSAESYDELNSLADVSPELGKHRVIACCPDCGQFAPGSFVQTRPLLVVKALSGRAKMGQTGPESGDNE